MRLHSLTLEHFRNYSSQSLVFEDAGSHLFVGPNGSGKTNLLEAMGILSLTKSLRGREDQDLVAWGCPHYRVIGEAETLSGETVKIEVVSVLAPHRRKAAFKNDVRTLLSDIVGLLPSVTFLPQDLSLFSGPPAERRRFLDTLLCQVLPGYADLLLQYQKILQQRNALLRQVVQGQQPEHALRTWDQELALHGSRITLARLELVETLNLTFSEELRSLTEDWGQATLRYERRGTERTLPAMEAELLSLLTEVRPRDLVLQSTTVGPHREDWQVIAADRPLPSFVSRGQERTAVLALLFLEVSYLELRRGERPIVLLDDVFSELDDAHQAALLKALQDHQVFLTATRVPPGAETMRMWDVQEGSVALQGRSALRMQRK